MLKLTAYKKTFSSIPVLEVPQLELEKNIYWLRGENGSGKTTFLKSAAGLIPFEGDILIDNISIKKQRRSYTACVNHASAEPVYPSFLTGNDLIDFYFSAKNGAKEIADEIADAFKMKQYLDNKASTYSSGMIKKLSLLLAFIGNPKLILLDEPFTTLDVEAVQTLKHFIQQSYSNGVMFIISSHQQLLFPHLSLSVKSQTITTE